VASDQPDFSGGCMVALYPPAAVANQLHRPGGLDVDDLHCTVAYLGDAVDVDLQALLAAVTPLAARAPIDAKVAGHGRFTGGDKGDVLVALVDAPALETLRRDLVDALTDAGISVPAEHGYTAHLSMSYLDADDDIGIDRLAAFPVSFPALTVKHGKRRIDLLFSGDPTAESIVPFARAAYAQGWAASGGPMTERVKAGCVAAVEHAIAHADDPQILEVTLRLGHLEGMWAALYERREALHAKHIQAVTTVWRRAARRLDLSVAIRRYRASLGLTETADPDDPAHRKLVAKAIAAAILYALASPEAASPDAIEPLILAIADALKAAQAEGAAAAAAIIADQAGRIGIDFNMPFADAWKALGDLGTYWGDATGWLGEITKGLAGDLGTTLARLGGEGASYDDMLTAAEDVLTGVDVRAVSSILDMAMSQSFSRGALALYGREGVTQVDYLTAGGSRVCVRCSGYEAKNPWPIADVPQPAVHISCRCVIAPAAPSGLLDPITQLGDTGGGTDA
jgi:2'-5' RNA ligase